MLIAYDGSRSARRAVDVAGQRFPGATATVVHVWYPVPPAEVEAAAAGMPLLLDDEDLSFAERSAREVCAEGVARAREVGLIAKGSALEAGPPVWQALLDAARAAGSDLVVMGTRGQRGVHGVLGSTSRALILNSPLPVLVVPAHG
jgi:nucleotide-binding universal stress UspA family protein